MKDTAKAHKTNGLHVELKAVGDEGIAELIVSVFGNVDSMQERIMPGAFTKSLATKLPKGVWGHDWMTPVAKTLEAKELLPGDPMLPERLALLGGLYIKAQFNLETTRGKEAFSDIKFGIIDEFSIGYRVKKDAYDTETNVRDLLEIELYEWSPVLVGANRETAVLGVKSDDQKTDTTATSPRAGLRLTDHSDQVLATVKGYTDRLVRLDERRAKEGRTISAATRTKINAARESLAAAVDALDTLLADDGKSADVQTSGEEGAVIEVDSAESMNLKFRASAISAQLLGV